VIKDRKTAEQCFANVQHNSEVLLKIGLSKKLAMNDTQGIPMMYYDQLNAVATHFDHISTSDIDKHINKHESKNHHNHPIQQAINLI
jgi:hypothetical protein